MNRELIKQNAREYFLNQKKIIKPGIDYIPVTGKVLDESDLLNLIDASLDMWLTAGRFNDQFEKNFSKVMEQEFCLTVNSGSSANLLAFSTLCSPLLGEERIKPGDEVITVAAGFPTTINPIVQNGCIPVFVDISLPTYQIDINFLEDARSEKTKAVFIAHTLGNTFDLSAISQFCEKYNLWLIEDCCDAIGAKYNGKSVGTFSDLATASFYPAHHITMGEGGAVLTSNKKLKKIAESLRDWGRDCWCPPGVDNSCKKRFGWQLGDLPKGYDHKYIYSQVGYNLKITDMQAAIGVSQLEKLNYFVARRKENFSYLAKQLNELESHFILPEATNGSDPSWFGFPLTVKASSPIRRIDIVPFLEKHKIGTRMLFGGNLLRHPLYQNVAKKVVGNLAISDQIMNDTFWIGVYPGLEEQHLSYIVEKLKVVIRN